MNDSNKDVKTKEGDPGWNDPPVFSYESHQTRQSKGLALNKRVVFPMTPNAEIPQNDSNSTDVPSPGILSTPPPSSGHYFGGGPPKSATKTSVPILTSTEKLHGENTIDNVEVPNLDVALRNFNESLEQLYDKEEKESFEIKRRIAIMEKMWNEAKFNTIIKEKIYKLSIALKENRFDDSDRLQRSLMVDHTNVCSTWMAGVRKLIYRKNELMKS